MAGRSHPTFKKRQKEQARKEKQRNKAERKAQRKLEKLAGSPEQDLEIAVGPTDGQPLEIAVDPTTDGQPPDSAE